MNSWLDRHFSTMLAVFVVASTSVFAILLALQ
jgi:hypothetical protein